MGIRISTSESLTINFTDSLRCKATTLNLCLSQISPWYIRIFCPLLQILLGHGIKLRLTGSRSRVLALSMCLAPASFLSLLEIFDSHFVFCNCFMPGCCLLWCLIPAEESPPSRAVLDQEIAPSLSVRRVALTWLQLMVKLMQKSEFVLKEIPWAWILCFQDLALSGSATGWCR